MRRKMIIWDALTLSIFIIPIIVGILFLNRGVYNNVGKVYAEIKPNYLEVEQDKEYSKLIKVEKGEKISGTIRRGFSTELIKVSKLEIYSTTIDERTQYLDSKDIRISETASKEKKYIFEYKNKMGENITLRLDAPRDIQYWTVIPIKDGNIIYNDILEYCNIYLENIKTDGDFIKCQWVTKDKEYKIITWLNREDQNIMGRDLERYILEGKRKNKVFTIHVN